MSRGSNLKDYGIDEEIDPKIKFNSLISVTVSTIMCLTAKCPVPKANVETTKLFLRTITDDKGNYPRNIKGILNLLNHYSGPYENDTTMEKYFEDSIVEKLMIVENEPPPEINNEIPKSRTWDFVKEVSPRPESQQSSSRRSGKSFKKSEKKSCKTLALRISQSKPSVINKS